ncbi:helix-turn-helix domain-containing protein [Yinghuangia sp. YIM S09857]|uniref:helix-turn-helix domain-containing protein n=1 Tax=Yinghuangia sp. YIM S09857 TaxID=3436929 RepID=UPI003F534598
MYFGTGCVAAESARRLRLSVVTLTYRLERVRNATGHDAAEPLHRCVLPTAVIGAHLLDRPTQLRPDAFGVEPQRASAHLRTLLSASPSRLEGRPARPCAAHQCRRLRVSPHRRRAA